MERHTLIARIKRGDRRALDELCFKFYNSLVAYARLLLNNEWAEDVVQDVFSNVWQRRKTLDDSNSLYRYLLRSVYNQSINYIHKCQHDEAYRNYHQTEINNEIIAYCLNNTSPILQKMGKDEIAYRINCAIDTLPPKCREILKMSYFEELPNKEISKQLGVALSTVENQLYTGRKQLKLKLSKNILLQ